MRSTADEDGSWTVAQAAVPPSGAGLEDGVLHAMVTELIQRLETAPLMRRAPAQVTPEEQAWLGTALTELSRLRGAYPTLAALPDMSFPVLQVVWPELAATLAPAERAYAAPPRPLAPQYQGEQAATERRVLAPVGDAPHSTAALAADDTLAAPAVRTTEQPAAPAVDQHRVAPAAPAVDQHRPAPAAPQQVAATASARRLITLAVGLAVLIYALDLTIVAAAAPTIVSEFHSLNLLGWLFAAYAIPAAATTLLYGRLADIFGRKPLFLVAMMGFLAASVACGFSTSMLQLIVFRALQGVFAGATFPLAVGIIADVYPIEQRARGFSVVPSAFAFASVLGPTVGGVLTQSVGWRWLFFINVPVILLAVTVLMSVYHEHRTPRRLRLQQVDAPGALLFAAGLTSVLVGVTIGGGGAPWLSWPVSAALLGGIALLAAFFVWEQHAAMPLLPLRVLGHRGLGGALLTIALLNWIIISFLVFIPSLAQGVLGGTATSAGAMLIPVMLTWSLTALVSLRLGQRYGFRTMALTGCGALAASLLLLALVRADSTLYVLLVPMVLVGLGAGLINPNMMLLAQNSLSDRDQGLAGALANCTSSLATALVAPVLGALELSRWAAHLGAPPPASSSLLTAAGQQALRTQFGAGYLQTLQYALGAALHDVFSVDFLALVVVTVWLALVVPSNAVVRRIRLRPLAR